VGVLRAFLERTLPYGPLSTEMKFMREDHQISLNSLTLGLSPGKGAEFRCTRQLSGEGEAAALGESAKMRGA
jgi:hypothetical protein